MVRVRRDGSVGVHHRRVECIGAERDGQARTAEDAAHFGDKGDDVAYILIE